MELEEPMGHAEILVGFESHHPLVDRLAAARPSPGPSLRAAELPSALPQQKSVYPTESKEASRVVLPKGESMFEDLCLGPNRVIVERALNELCQFVFVPGQYLEWVPQKRVKLEEAGAPTQSRTKGREQADRAGPGKRILDSERT